MEISEARNISITLVEEDASEAVKIGDFLVSQGFEMLDMARTEKDFRDAITRRPPRIALIDLQVGKPHAGIRLTEWISREHRDTHSVALSGHDALVLPAIQAGASSYVPKDADYLRELPGILRKVSAGGGYALPEGRATGLVIGQAMKQGMELKRLQVYSRMTKQERKVLFLLREGNTRAEAAERLKISPYTIHAHLYSVLGKTSFSTVRELLENWWDLLGDIDGTSPGIDPDPGSAAKPGIGSGAVQKGAISGRHGDAKIRLDRKRGLNRSSRY